MCVFVSVWYCESLKEKRRMKYDSFLFSGNFMICVAVGVTNVSAIFIVVKCILSQCLFFRTYFGNAQNFGCIG